MSLINGSQFYHIKLSFTDYEQSSVIEHLPTFLKAMGTIPVTGKQNKAKLVNSGIVMKKWASCIF